jgi:hypothetical protein
MKKLVYGFIAMFVFSINGISQPMEKFEERKLISYISCHEVSITIFGVVTVNDFYICCGDGFTNNLASPPRLCRRVSKKFFDLVQNNQMKQAQEEEEELNIRDLIPDYDNMQKMTEIIVEKSSTFEYDGKLCSIKLGKYKVGEKGEIIFEIEEKNN